jgi:4-amino-4-deoxy-L-arabinose transferase-like glycosyltransferase
VTDVAARAARGVVFVAACSMLAIAAWLPVIPDEAYYWTWSRALARTYFDHPPGVAWMLAVSTALFGADRLALRLPSLLGALVCVVVAARLARRGSDAGPPVEVAAHDTATRDAGWSAAALLFAAPMFTVGYAVGTHDAWHGAFALLALAATARAIDAVDDDARGRTASRAWCFVTGIAWTTPVLLKHAHALLALGALGALLASAEGRRLLARPASLAGVAAGLALVAPWLTADLSAGALGSLHFQLEHVTRTAPSRPLAALPLALGSMAGTLGPLLLAGLFARTRRFRSCALLDRVALGAALALVAACVVAVGFGSGEANWPMPAGVLVAPQLARAWARGPWPRVRAALLTLGALAALVVAVHVATGVLPLRPSRDPFARGVGWPALGAEAARLAEAHHARALVTRRYQSASLLRWYTRDVWPVLELGTARRRSQYDVWARPALGAGDVVVVVHPGEGPPPEVPGRPLAPPTRLTRDTVQGRVIDVWTVTAVVLEAPPTIVGEER